MNNQFENESPQEGKRSGNILAKRRYLRMLVNVISIMSVVSLAPLVIMTWINYNQYQNTFHKEMLGPISKFTSNTKYSLEFFLEERISVLSLLVKEKAFEDLRDPKKLKQLFKNMKRTIGGVIDIGLIDSEGRQVSYVGPYKLQDKNYADQDWFHEVNSRDTHVSDMFLGHRMLPHFVIAVKKDDFDSEPFVLRSTIDSEMINRHIHGLKSKQSRDVFIINRDGILQTSSRYFGQVLDELSFPVPSYTPDTEVLETVDKDGKPLIIGYAFIKNSRFILMLVDRPGAMQESWLSLRNELALFLSISVILILLVVALISGYMVKKIREGDIKRAGIIHNVEYTHRMAVIGRLAAGVAHEINNPLAIINEKAGLLKDLYSMSDKQPSRQKVEKMLGSVLRSVDRCAKITRRLLSFAKHLDIQQDKIDVRTLLEEVLGFLEKEAHYRGIKTNFEISENIPTINSDRGQLEQVFLNIVNNAFAAMSDGGALNISAKKTGVNEIAVGIEDNGSGIPEKNLEYIFDPFFTTKKESGTGLGLSITYGIVEKLGGDIKVESEVGKGTCFTVTLPIEME